MELKINDGRNCFYQWDTGQSLIVEDHGLCTEVHFCNKNTVNTLVCKIKESDGKRIVDVPNILLQEAERITAYLFYDGEDGSKTKCVHSFLVINRQKPEDYVYTETEILKYETLANRIAELEKNGASSEQIADAVEEYMAEHPVEGGSVELDTSLTQSGMAADAKSVGDKIAEITGVSLVEPAEDDIPKVFFGGALQQTKDEAVVPFRYISKTDDFSGYAEIKAQGNSSMNYPKKNQTVKMFKDAECAEKLKVDFKGWGKQNKHVYKANWIDLSHARNVVSARLWSDVVKSRANYAELPELLRTSPNQGAIDGFPVKVYAEGVYQGRYTLNIPKDKWTFNMDDKQDNHCVLYSENYVSGCFRAAANINGSDWTDEIHDNVPASIKTRWNEVISFVMNSTDEDFKANLSQYFYVDSLLDYYLFALTSCGLDAFGKNQIYATYDGQRWIASMYDMDSTWGLYWNGSKFVATDYARTSYEDFINTNGNLLYNRLEQLFCEELQARWAELKHGALSIENVINRFERFTDIAPADLVKEDYAATTAGGKFTGIPAQTGNHIQQLRYYAHARLAWTDVYVAGLSPAPSVPCQGVTLDKATLTFDESGTQTLTATVIPDGCTDAVVWESDATNIATVVDGFVTTVSAGTATITVTCGEYSASCFITVNTAEEAGVASGFLFDLDLTKATAESLTISDNTGNLTAKINNANSLVENGVCLSTGYSNTAECTWVNPPAFANEVALEVLCFGVPNHLWDNLSHTEFIGSSWSGGFPVEDARIDTMEAKIPYFKTDGSSANASGTSTRMVMKDDGTSVLYNDTNLPNANVTKFNHIVLNVKQDGTLQFFFNGYPAAENPKTTDFSAWDFSSLLNGFYFMRGSADPRFVTKSARMYNRCLTKDEIRNNLAFEAKKLGY